MNLLGCHKRNLKKNSPDAELLDQKNPDEQPLKSTLVTDQNRQLKTSQEPAVRAELIANKQPKAEVAAGPIVREAEEVLRLIMAQQDELQRRQITDAEKTEKEVQPVTTKLQPRVEKLPNKSRSPKPKLAVKVEGSTSQDALPEVNLPSPTKISGVLLEEKSAELIVASGQDEEYKPATPVTEAINVRQIVSEDSNHPEVTVATVEIAENSSTDELPDFFHTDDTEILPLEETMPQATGLAEANFLRSAKIFGDEVMDTLEQLVELINLEQEEAPLATPEPHETFIQDTVIFLNQETTESIEASETNAFAEYIMTVPKPEVGPDINTIIADASDKTLEETLVQLSFYLTEADKNSESNGIEAALKDVVESLPRSNISYTDKENKVAITPELTSKLLTLLRAVGYDNPQEVLVEFIRQHDFEFLLQAIRYLYQLIDDNNRQEFSPIKALNFTAMKVDEPLTTRLGHAIMQYFFTHKIVPEI